MGRRVSNDNREIKETVSEEEKAFLCQNAHYVGSPDHKRKLCRDYNFKPLTHYSHGGLCDEEKIIVPAHALKLLKLGIRQGLISGRKKGDFPINIWCVDSEGNVWESQGDSSGNYHGYLLEDDSFRETVLTEWKRKNA